MTLDPRDAAGSIACALDPAHLSCDGPHLVVAGVGGGGGNAVTRMAHEGLHRTCGARLVALNTDVAALRRAHAHDRLQLGAFVTRGLGAGARPEIGQLAVEESRDAVTRMVAGADIVFVTCGMGGGTGTGAAPIVCDVAHAAGALVVGIVTRPFLFEGRRRHRHADAGIAAMRTAADMTVVVPNERLLATLGRDRSFVDALTRADEVLWHATDGLANLVRGVGVLNVDLADVRTVVASGGISLVGVGIAEGTAGESRARDACDGAMTSPLLETTALHGARSLLVHVTGGPDLTLGEVHEIAEHLHAAVGEETEIVFGATQEATHGGRVRVCVIATGLAPSGDGMRSSMLDARVPQRAAGI